MPVRVKLATVEEFLKGERSRQAKRLQRARQVQRVSPQGGQATVHVSKKAKSKTTPHRLVLFLFFVFVIARCLRRRKRNQQEDSGRRRKMRKRRRSRRSRRRGFYVLHREKGGGGVGPAGAARGLAGGVKEVEWRKSGCCDPEMGRGVCVRDVESWLLCTKGETNEQSVHGSRLFPQSGCLWRKSEKGGSSATPPHRYICLELYWVVFNV